MENVVVSAIIYAVILGVCWWRPTVARVVIGLRFMAMGVLVNGLVALIAPQLFVELAAQAPLGVVPQCRARVGRTVGRRRSGWS
jgi:hypothetical protein